MARGRRPPRTPLFRRCPACLARPAEHSRAMSAAAGVTPRLPRRTHTLPPTVSGLTSQQAVSRRRLTIYYGVLLAVLTVVVVVVFSAGAGEDAQPTIAGFYTPRGPINLACLTDKFQVQQSGQFVTLDNGPGTVGGKLKWKDNRLTGTVNCAAGPDQAI